MKRRWVKAPAGKVREQLGTIFRRCSPDLHAYLRRRLKGSQDAADLTQEIFERFLRGDRGASARNPYAYLFGIASNVIADAHAAHERDVIIYDSAVVEVAANALPGDSYQTLTGADLEEELMLALAKLPEALQAAILLTKRDGLSCQEAAMRMGTTEASVRVYVCRARAQLRLLLKRI